ncbi:MAG: hypothetical protein ABJC07_06255, partial [Acidobacteriota bacterium]
MSHIRRHPWKQTVAGAVFALLAVSCASFSSRVQVVHDEKDLPRGCESRGRVAAPSELELRERAGQRGANFVLAPDSASVRGYAFLCSPANASPLFLSPDNYGPPPPPVQSTLLPSQV